MNIDELRVKIPINPEFEPHIDIERKVSNPYFPTLPMSAPNDYILTIIREQLVDYNRHYSKTY